RPPRAPGPPAPSRAGVSPSPPPPARARGGAPSSRVLLPVLAVPLLVRGELPVDVEEAQHQAEERAADGEGGDRAQPPVEPEAGEGEDDDPPGEVHPQGDEAIPLPHLPSGRGIPLF